MSSSSLVILKGFSPTNISYIMIPWIYQEIPRDQISIFSSYYFPLRISGQTYSGVPQKVVLILLSWWTDHPKSHNLMTFYFLIDCYFMKDDVLGLYISVNDP